MTKRRQDRNSLAAVDTHVALDWDGIHLIKPDDIPVIAAMKMELTDRFAVRTSRDPDFRLQRKINDIVLGIIGKVFNHHHSI